MKQATVGPPAQPIVPQSSPAIAPPPAAEATDSVTPRAALGGAAHKAASIDDRGRRNHERREEQPAEQKVAVAAPEAPAAPAESDLTPEEAAVLRGKRGNMAIEFRPKLGGAVRAFQIMKISAFVDGRKVVAVDDKTFWEGKPQIELWQGELEAGAHVLTVEVAYRGNGHGVFSYFDNYHYDVRSSTQFRLEDGPRLQMMVDLIDKGGMNTSFDKRLLLAFAQR
jgi:hypothetical protein